MNASEHKTFMECLHALCEAWNHVLVDDQTAGEYLVQLPPGDDSAPLDYRVRVEVFFAA